jgi:hypothetical protein
MSARGTTIAALASALAAALGASAPSGAQVPSAEPLLPARDTEAVVLSGEELGEWAAPANQTARLPLVDEAECRYEQGDPTERCDHNEYAEPHVDSARVAAPAGTPIDRLLGYRWHVLPNGKGKWRQIPFQVDERFVRYLANHRSGFSFYSGEDQHTTYAFDREGFRWTESDPANPCVARPDSAVATDPIAGLDHNDELAFMARDAGAAAPADAELPNGIEAARRVAVVDPLRPAAGPRYVYVMRARDGGPEPEYTRENGYVGYERDANADFFERSQSSYDDYGNARRGIVCDAEGNVLLDANGEPRIERRRPRDYAWVTTDRYRFRYDGRWLMTQLRVSPNDDGESYGPDLIDRWKARAFQQDPSSETPCCGYEEEDTNWGGSSTLIGERTGPVRAIRETWGADSGTNVIRRETFYRDEIRQTSYLRVHPMPPLDGIYAQWDFNAGRMTRFYNEMHPNGVAIDGRNDEAFGNFDDPCNERYDANETSDADQGYRSIYEATPLCAISPYHQSIDMTDPTFNGPQAGLEWAVTAGEHGTIVDSYSIEARDVTPGASQFVAAVPYYRDDSCFDDGTGTDPGPRVRLRSSSEETTYGDPPQPRECWTPEDGVPEEGSRRFFQGSIGTHGVHILFVGESDNARLTLPVTEMVSDWRIVPLPGERGAEAGRRYGRGGHPSLQTAVTPATNPARASGPGRGGPR